MAGGGDSLDFGGGGLGDIGGGGPSGGGFPGGDTGMGMGPGDLGNITGMGFGGPGGFDPTSGYPSGDQSGSGGLPPETATNVTAPQAQAPAPGTTSTSIGGTQTGTPGPTGGQQPAPPAQQPQQAPQASQLQQLIQQIMKAASPNQANAKPAGPSNLTPSLAQLSGQAQQQPTVPGGNGADSTVIVPNAGQGDILSGSQHEGGFGLAPEVEQQPRPPGTPQEGLGIPETGPGGGLGDLARQAPGTGLPATSTDPSGRFSDLGLDPSQEQPRPPGTPQEAGSQFPTEEQPRPPGTPQESAGIPQQPTPPLPQPRPPGAPQATPATPQTPATPGQAQQGFPGGAMNPMKFIGDILQLLGGNPTPLLSDLASQFGMGPQGGGPFGQQPQSQQPQQPQTQAQPPAEAQPQTEEQQQQQQRRQDLGQPGTYVIDDKGQRVRVQTDAKGNPMYDKSGKPIPAPEQQAPDQQPAGPIAPGKAHANLMHGQYGAPNSPQTHVPANFNGGHINGGINQAAAPHFIGFLNDLKAAGAPINSVGGYDPRPGGIAGRGMTSQHTYGNAIDINQIDRNKTTGGFKEWADSHPQQFRAAMNKWGIINGGDWRGGLGPDFGHFEWNGGGMQTAAYPPQPLPPGQNRPPGSVPGGYAKQVIQIESGGKTGPGNRTGSNIGLAQFSPDLERKYGLNAGNRDNPQAVAQALQRERADHRPALVKALGREPTDAEYYFAHQQGATGGPALLHAAQTNPNTPAYQVIQKYYRPGVAQRAIHGNIPSNNPLRRVPPTQVTAGQFVGMWKDRFNRGYQGGNVAQQPQAPQQPRIRGLDLLHGGSTAQSDGGVPIDEVAA